MPVVPSKYRRSTTYDIVKAELVATARHRGTITYQEIAKLVGFPLEGNYMGAEIGRLLGEISEDEHRRRRPMLSAIVVTTSGMPGPGFFKLARDLAKLRGTKLADQRAFWKSEVRAVHSTWKTVFRTERGV